MNMRSATVWGWALAIAVSLATGLAMAQPRTSAAMPDTVGGQNADAATGTNAIDPQHAQLATLAGHWTVRQSMWTDPKAAPVIDHGTATYTMVLGDHHLRQNLHIASGKPFEGLGYIGYDNATGTYYSSWMDTNFTGMILAHGDYDAARRTYTFTGKMAGAGKDGASIPVREVMRVTDSNHFVYEYYENHDGKEALAIRLQYTRAD